MDSIVIRRGEDVTLPLDSGDQTAVSAEIFIGKPGEVYILSKSIFLDEGKGVFTFSGAETQIPVDTYFYQINTTDGDGHVEKYPSPDPSCEGCSTKFPKFIVCEALDEIGVS